jgi:hypothetical protein
MSHWFDAGIDASSEAHRGYFGHRQSIRRGTFSSVNVLITQIRDYIDNWNTDAKPFTWTATTDEILARSDSSRPTSRNSSTTTRSDTNRITRH